MPEHVALGTKYIRAWRSRYNARSDLASAIPNLHVLNPRVALTAAVRTIQLLVLLTLRVVQTLARIMSLRHHNVISRWQRKKSDYRSKRNVDYITAKSAVASTITRGLSVFLNRALLQLSSHTPSIWRIASSFLDYMRRQQFQLPHQL